MKLELLYFEGCPSWQNGLVNLRAALHDLDLPAEVDQVKVRNQAQATRLRFCGSPSFHLDGMDLWPDDWELYSLSCRVYATPQGLQGWPSIEMLRERVSALAQDGPAGRPGADGKHL
jgi:hypothetical protein